MIIAPPPVEDSTWVRRFTGSGKVLPLDGWQFVVRRRKFGSWFCFVRPCGLALIEVIKDTGANL